MKPNIVAFIFARGGSKGVPRKNVRLLAGVPLIAHSIQQAQSSPIIDRVVVSTDDPEIAEISKQYGAEVPFIRPAELARDDAPEWLAWQHALNAVEAAGAPEVNVFVSLPPTSPMRAVEDIDACVTLLLKGDADVVITVRPGERSPYFNMVTLTSDGEARLVMQSSNVINRRQDAPAVYDVTTVAYAARPDFVRAANSIFQGRVKAVIVPAERSVDIDTELDFKFAEFLLEEMKRSDKSPQPIAGGAALI